MVEVGNMIIGHIAPLSDGKTKKSFMTSIINGPFDADKLDYIKRDCYIAGLSLAYDIERLLYKIGVKRVPNGNEWRLTIDAGGVTAIEELTFSKIMLYSYIYYHPKVLICEEITKDLVYGMRNLGLLEHPCDFLKYTDSDIEKLIYDSDENIAYPGYPGKYTLAQFSKRIKHRILPKKCFEINQRNVQNNDVPKKKIKMNSSVQVSDTVLMKFQKPQMIMIKNGSLKKLLIA